MPGNCQGRPCPDPFEWSVPRHFCCRQADEDVRWRREPSRCLSTGWCWSWDNTFSRRGGGQGKRRRRLRGCLLPPNICNFLVSPLRGPATSRTLFPVASSRPRQAWIFLVNCVVFSSRELSTSTSARASSSAACRLLPMSPTAIFAAGECERVNG